MPLPPHTWYSCDLVWQSCVCLSVRWSAEAVPFVRDSAQSSRKKGRLDDRAGSSSRSRRLVGLPSARSTTTDAPRGQPIDRVNIVPSGGPRAAGLSDRRRGRNGTEGDDDSRVDSRSGTTVMMDSTPSNDARVIPESGPGTERSASPDDARRGRTIRRLNRRRVWAVASPRARRLTTRGCRRISRCQADRRSDVYSDAEMARGVSFGRRGFICVRKLTDERRESYRRWTEAHSVVHVVPYICRAFGNACMRLKGHSTEFDQSTHVLSL